MSANSSKRRKWEIKSKESFDTSIAVARDPDTPDKSLQKSSESEVHNELYPDLGVQEEESDHETINSEDLLSSKVSAILDDIQNPQQQVISSDYESHQESESPELKKSMNPFAEEMSASDDGEEIKPSAPPISPSNEKKKKKVSKSKRKEKKQKSSRNTNYDPSTITSQLKHFKDDIVNIDEDANNNDATIIAVPGLLVGKANPSNSVNTVFCEKMNRFVVAPNKKSIISQDSERLQEYREKSTRSTHAIFIQTGFRTFSVFCQGLLAGLCLAHCLVIFLLHMSPERISDLYSPSAAHVFFAIIFILCNICLVAACDRCDIRGNGVFFGHGIKVPWTPAMYISALILTLVAIRAEDVLANKMYYGATMDDKISELVHWWRWMCVSRTAVVVLAWVVVVPDPHTDAFNTHLMHLENS